jgi:hypothetical protein
MSTAESPQRPAFWWGIALAGEFVLVFAAVALSGPGRIDIVDGQTRYEVARSLREHGDSVVRDPHVWFWVFPGRAGQRYTPYRLPQSVLGAGAITLADATGPVSEGRRHFFFVLTSAFVCALLAVCYALWFRHVGLAPGAALLWSLLGVFCTPSWFYGTSTFDDILGTAAVVGAVCVAFLTRRRLPLLGSAAAGLLLGVAFNCKEPLGIFVFAVLMANREPGRPWRGQLGRVLVVLAGLALGVIVYAAYDAYKYPPETHAALAQLQASYVPFWPRNLGAVAAAVFGLTLSPGVGMFWYFPPLVLCLCGLRSWWPAEKGFCRAVLAGGAVFFGFLCCLTFFAGDPTWGPRYLTPVFGVLWLFAPAGAARLWPGFVKFLLCAGVLVQLLGLSVDPHRLYIQRHLTAAFYYDLSPWLYGDSAVSHLLNRPREIAEVLDPNRPRSEVFTPSPSPTFAFPVINQIYEEGPAAIHRYHVLNSLRPWWASQWYLAPQDRPVDLLGTLLLLTGAAFAGLGLLTVGYRRLVAEPSPAGLVGAASVSERAALPAR